jgi:hypothetical protein
LLRVLFPTPAVAVLPYLLTRAPWVRKQASLTVTFDRFSGASQPRGTSCGVGTAPGRTIIVERRRVFGRCVGGTEPR